MPLRSPQVSPRRAGVLVGLALVLSAVPVSAVTVPTDFADEGVVQGLDDPVGLAFIPEAASAPETRVLFVEQRSARVGLVLRDSVVTVGVVPGVSTDGFERGLVGIAVDPRWPAAPYLYVQGTDERFGRHISISRFTVTGDLGFTYDGKLAIDPSSRYDVLRDPPDDSQMHNGGTLRFGPDGQLYVSLGDDTHACLAQDTTALSGKILRLDVSRLPEGPGGPAPRALLVPPDNPFVAHPDSSAQLVWALGLRNPFRFQIDPATGALYIGDVGENNWEELDRARTAGRDFGWPFYEGPSAFAACVGVPNSVFAVPIATYAHNEGAAIVSAGLYRQPADGISGFPAEYDGDCFYLDFQSGILRRITRENGAWVLAEPEEGQPFNSDWGLGFDHVTDMLELPDGSMWYCRRDVGGQALTGEIRRLHYAPVSTEAPRPDVEGALAFAAPAPSPSRGPVRLAWTQPRSGSVRLMVLDATGRVVRLLEEGEVLAAGQHERTWDGRLATGEPAPPGAYFARLQVNADARTAHITLMR